MIDKYTYFKHSNLIEGVDSEDAIKRNIQALEYLLKQEDIFNHEAVKEAHRIIMEKRQPEIAGEYKKTNNYINKGREGKKVFCPPNKVKEKMEELFQFRPETEEEAWEAKMVLVNIHPFLDGNGRISRCWYYAACKKIGVEPRMVKYEERHEYYEQCDQIEELRIDPLAETKEWDSREFLGKENPF